MAKKSITYSEAIDEIEQIIERIENNEVGIDDLSKSVARVAELLKVCKAQLKGTEEEIDKILKEFSE